MIEHEEEKKKKISKLCKEVNIPMDKYEKDYKDILKAIKPLELTSSWLTVISESKSSDIDDQK
jgi:hypothetical protein